MSLKQELRERIRVQGKSKETHKTYWFWIEKFLRFQKAHFGDWVHPKDMGEPEVEAWLTNLATRQRVSKNTQNVALQAVCYMYREVLKRPLVGVNAFRAKRPTLARNVLDVSEVARLFENLDGIGLLVAQMIYGCGLRIGDVVKLRVKDVSFERRQLHIHSGKGDKSRHTSFPEVLHGRVKEQVEKTRKLYEWDLRHNPNGVSLPGAFRRKSPKACLQFGWYYVFASEFLNCDEDGLRMRHHRHRSHLSRLISEGARRAKIDKRVTSHILRHCYATHANEQGVDMRQLQVLLGHTSIETTETYVHTNKDKSTASKSPLQVMLESPPKERPHNDKLQPSNTVRQHHERYRASVHPIRDRSLRDRDCG